MCLILFCYDMLADYQLVLAANRDEYYNRPTTPLSFWPDAPHILAGRDLKGKGTWLGVTRNGRIAAITNYRDPAAYSDPAPSRGLVVSNFLKGSESPRDYLEGIKAAGHRYNGFNLLVGDTTSLFYYSNRSSDIRQIKPGLYGLSNHLLDTPWPKTNKGKERFKALLEMKPTILGDDVFSLLADRSYPPEQMLPDTGVGRRWERILSPIFISSRVYGTRSSAVVIVKKTGRLTIAERTFGRGGRAYPSYQPRTFRLFVS